ncbi:MAG: polysaccharide deacetylase family protein, partial [Hungatella sp.]
MKVSMKKLMKQLGVAALVLGLCTGMSSFPSYAEGGSLKAYYEGFFYANGWSAVKEDNTLCQAPNGSYLTAMRISLTGQPEGMTGTVAYQSNLSGQGWLDWSENRADNGATDTEAPLEAIRVKLTGDLETNYDIYYSVLQSGNWTAWAKNGETAGVEAQGLRVDGIKISTVNKGGEVPPEQPAAQGVDPTRPMVALTFDDGPSSEVTNRILNSLEAHGARATFFMVGNRVPGTADTVRRMVALGSEVGNHTYDHKYLTHMGDVAIRSNVGQANTTIANICGVTPGLMRPTGGNYNSASLSTLGSMGMPAIMWSIDTLDWKHRNAQKTINTVLTQVQDGDIILMHDIYGTTADAAEVIIPELVARGYQLVTV